MASAGDRLTCRQLVELVWDHLEGALAPAGHARFEAHVAGCPGCRAYVAQMRATLRAMRAAAGLDASRPEPAGLLAAFRDRTPSR